MSLLIENTEELLTVVKKLNLKVASVDELRQLLAEINANYNPEAARQRTGKMIGVAVPTSMATAAGITSFFVITGSSGAMSAYQVGGLGLIWGACALVSTAAVLASAIMTSSRRGVSPLQSGVAESRGSFAERIVTGITKELS